MSKHELPPSIARELFDYRDGLLLWRPRARTCFSDDRSYAVWNKRFAGKPAGYLHRVRSGVRRRVALTMNGKTVRVYHATAVWAWHKNEWPSSLVDHEDGNTLNDRIGNLRDVSSAKNSQNMRMHPGNKSGVTGVCWHKQRGKWKVEIMANRVKKHIGVFDNLEDAIAARKAAEIALGFHPNHGRNSHVQG